MTTEQELDLLRRENASLRTALVAIADADPAELQSWEQYKTIIRRICAVALAR